MNIREIRDYFNTKPIEFVLRENYELKEDNLYVPRFRLKDVKQIANIPVNKPIKPSKDIITKAIKYGMVFLISYKGEKDRS